MIADEVLAAHRAQFDAYGIVRAGVAHRLIQDVARDAGGQERPSGWAGIWCCIFADRSEIAYGVDVGRIQDSRWRAVMEAGNAARALDLSVLCPPEEDDD